MVPLGEGGWEQPRSRTVPAARAGIRPTAEALVPVLEEMTEADVGKRIEERFMSAENCAISGGDYSPTFTLEASDRLFFSAGLFSILESSQCAAELTAPQ